MKTMRLRFLSVILISLAASTSCTQEELDQFLSPGLSQSEVISGLREALKVGTDTSVGRLNALNGYFADQEVKILLPPDAQVIQQYVSILPGGQFLIDEVVLKINRAAEQAATEAKPIFVNAITTITIQDGFTILRGGDTAATEYLRGRTIDSLQASFTPPITQALSTPIVGGISAESAYSNLVNVYNQTVPVLLGVPQITQNSLSVHTTRRALDGLFVKVADEEKKIRRDPLHRVTEILKRVFGA
jgi:hypothetical protein